MRAPSPSPTPDLEHSSFYCFAPLDDAQAVADRVRAQAHALLLLGSVLVAPEGINGMLAGTRAALATMEQALRSDPRLAAMPFKRSLCRTQPFHRLKVHCKAEIVPLGLPEVDATRDGGRKIAPRDWDAYIAVPDVLLLDNRNSFEFRLGRFAGAVDPGVAHFRDFADYVQRHATDWQARGQRIAMYCTGGIRCEKTAAWMHGLGLDVAQLDGGILQYFADRQGQPKTWQGECFVFDNRVALDADLRETDTTIEQVYQAEPDGAWRLARARRLASA